jgi:hypothetical protein
MGRIILYFLIGISVSFYLFPIGFTFLPPAINTKMILAVIGGISFGIGNIRTGHISVSTGVLGAFGIAVFFSLICYIAMDINHTSDYSYVNYVGSFFAWLGGANAVCLMIKRGHGKSTFRLLVLYLAAVCFTQCILALLIDNNESFKMLVDSYVDQGQEFYEEKDRLYGIGAALDSAGVRFAVVLVMIAALICHDDYVRKHDRDIVFLLLTFFTVAVVGNAISRTTIIGLAAAMLYIFVFSKLFSLEIQVTALRFGLWFGALLLLTIAISTYLYLSNEAFYGHMRFAFEGFFNLVEHGEWRTASTDKLNGEMWIWPKDIKTWLIGSGRFGSFVYGTDIGYCRFILYCGLSGFSIFASFFIYNGLFFMYRSQQYAMMFLTFIVMTFLFWIKVATDIFFIYALFFCLDEFMHGFIKTNSSNENSLLHS